MADDSSRNRLGRGLAALIGEMDKPVVPETVATGSDSSIAIEMIRANPNNPRRRFGDDELQDLSNSIREHGIVQPILVRPVNGASDCQYEIVAGERRWRAAQLAGLHSVPILVRDVEDRQALEIAIVENVQRADLNPIEEALGYNQLVDDYAYTQADLARIIGKSRSHVANTLRLLKLPESVRAMVSVGSLSAGHARALVTADNPEELASRIVKDGLSVRQVETLTQPSDTRENKSGKSSAAVEKDADTLALEKSLGDLLGLKVAVNFKNNGSGDIRISYKSLEQLDDICRRLQQ